MGGVSEKHRTFGTNRDCEGDIWSVRKGDVPILVDNRTKK